MYAPMTDRDTEFGAFCDSILNAIERAERAMVAAAIEMMRLAYAQGRGAALAELSRVPAPTSAADRRARYSAGIREPRGGRESAADRRAREQARAWGLA